MKRVDVLIQEESGSVLVEAALVFPVLLLLGLSSFEFSNFFFQHQAVTTGVRDAARYLARTNDPTNSINQTYAQNIAVTGEYDGSGPTRVPGWSQGQVAISVTQCPVPCGGVAYNVTGTPTSATVANTIYAVTVSTQFAYQQLGFLSLFGFSDPSITIAHFERWIGG